MMRKYFRLVAYLIVAMTTSWASADDAVDFFRAVNVDNDRTVKALLARGFDPNMPNPQGQVGLFLAMRDESPKVALALLAHPAIRIDTPTAEGETAAMMAALRGNLEWTRMLLERGAALNRPGWAPLHYAASGPEVAVVRLLLERGAHIDAVSPNGTTALMMAARYGSFDSAELLLARGADTRLRNQRALSAADFARAAGREALALRLQPQER